MAKTQVGILFGGRSVEHDISLLSAGNIVKNIDRNKFDVHLIGIAKDGKWHLTESVQATIDSGQPLSILLDPQNPYLISNNAKLKLDLVFPVLHGTDGEDGSIQGLLQTLRIPYVGSGVIGSSASMDKLLTKRVLKSADVPVASFLDYHISERASISFQEVKTELGMPVIIKPTNLGSSVGVSKVADEAEFSSALDDAFKYDDSVLIEEFVVAREVECAILGNINPIVSMAGEVVLSDKYTFYSFAAKYEDPDSAKITIPATMPEEIHEKVKELSLKAYKLLNCHDLSRVDLFVKADGTVLVNEINTIPGFTNISMYPSLMKHSGIEYQELITQLLEMALERHTEQARITTDYESHL